MASAPSPPAFLSRSAAARYLGTSRTTLQRLEDIHPLYAPAVHGVPGSGRSAVGSGLVRYHREQIRLIEAVLVGGMDPDEAHLRWEHTRLSLGRKGQE